MGIVGPSLAPPVRSCSPPTPPIMSKKASRSSSKKAKKSGSNVFDMFTQAQVAEFKDGFQIMDRDRDGVISKDDLRGAFSEMFTDGEVGDAFALMDIDEDTLMIDAD